MFFLLKETLEIQLAQTCFVPFGENGLEQRDKRTRQDKIGQNRTEHQGKCAYQQDIFNHQDA